MLLDGARRRASHRQVRTERVAEDVNTLLAQTGDALCATDRLDHTVAGEVLQHVPLAVPLPSATPGTGLSLLNRSGGVTTDEANLRSPYAIQPNDLAVRFCARQSRSAGSSTAL